MTNKGRFRRVRGSRRIAALLFSGVALLAAAVASAATSGMTIAFNGATLPYLDGTILTTQLAEHYGVVFSADDADLPPEYRLSLGSQENVIRDASTAGEKELLNPFRIFFLAHSVTSVSLTIEDRNVNDQRHTLTAFSSSGTILDAASFQDGVAGESAGIFTVSVSTGTTNHPLAYVVEIEQPFGAEVLHELRYQTRGGH